MKVVPPRCSQSTSEAEDDRALRRAQAVRMKLGSSGSMAVPFPDKPKGMHWRTYERLRAEHDGSERTSTLGMATRLGFLSRHAKQ